MNFRLTASYTSIKSLNLSRQNHIHTAIAPRYPDIRAMIEKNYPVIEQLQTYIKEGYRKIISIGNTSKDLQCIVFLTLVKNEEVINVLVIDPVKFISKVLDPKIQEIAKGKFYIAAYHSGR